MGSATEKLQWHPAFFAGLQIEFEAESENLIFENEHQLGTKPKEIDVLVIKKIADIPIHKNIGRIFRKYNIIEYKSPEDYISIDDFYKVYAYVCFYKSDTVKVDDIKINEVTMSLVTHKYPKKLINHLKETGYVVKSKEAGIYYIEGFMFPIQIIHTVKLSEEENLWLRSLTNHLEQESTAEKIVKEYGKNQENNLYKSVMNIIVNANRKIFETEDGDMRDVLMEIIEEKMKEKMKDELDDARESGMEDGRKEEARLNALKFLKNGVSFELVEKSITILTHEELMEIYNQSKQF